ncbi:RraA family protein [Acidaminococcus fermentans]|mgnify:FL=1|uniref:Putative 4-hydroxy-4-methyl-2-oxoglutarate aldolase n=2 Tax=Acidaminococcus fermentans TaxID=905 RepID=D2RMS4_ACIFV|nr:RraA family protein [Acidaminococcus fermentans]ADB48376.1 Dimethylmenaquinone methyltransferase [Acidaminococcus fermentans DSM 20731]MCF0140374.1 RraA family protein [Acidaminococcus fermentans]MCI6285297.1 RraA family protein [Acidaminococcus fermentans]MCI7195556.1 RraA family protein [Acidaminococcus fermentans]MDD7195610.1 RraA family protein [Acidaminococcus fermentans]
MSIGNRIFLKKPEAPQELLDAFSTIPAANISDTMGRLVGMHPRIKLQSAPKNPINVGRALTIKTRSGDNLMLHKALNMAKPGDVIILSNDGGESYRSLIGEIMFTYLASRGAAGIIIDGPIRDIDAVRKMEMPIYATGTNPAGPYKEGPGEINVPISCGGISINPGDIIVMDEDGVIVIPLQEAETVLKNARAFQEKDEAKLLAAQEGRAKREWVDALIEKKEVEILDKAWNE